MTLTTTIITLQIGATVWVVLGLLLGITGLWKLRNPGSLQSALASMMSACIAASIGISYFIVKAHIEPSGGHVDFLLLVMLVLVGMAALLGVLIPLVQRPAKQRNPTV